MGYVLDAIRVELLQDRQRKLTDRKPCAYGTVLARDHLRKSAGV